MTRAELRATLIAALGEIAPEADFSRLRGDAPLREELDLDSMDFMNFLIAISERLQVDIPETAYASVSTLDRCLDYVALRLGVAS
ncbi:MAG: acyl carrier protein [Gemmatimonadetes bacterium]|nr:acyl carrier protein [Gemmatimonadota bacterium]